MTDDCPYTGIDPEIAASMGLTACLTPTALEMQAFDRLPRRLREYLNYARQPPSAHRATRLLKQLRELAPNAPLTVIERISVSVLQANDVERAVTARRRARLDLQNSGG